MNLSGTGLTNRPETEPRTDGPSSARPAPGGLKARLEANRRAVVLAAAGVAVAAAGGAYLLLFAGASDPLAGDTGPSGPRSGAVTAAPTPTEATVSPTASSGAGAAGSAGASRNPFAPRPSASSTATGSAGATGSTPEATATTVTATVTDPAVYLSLFSVAADGEAVFSVNGTTYTQSPGDTFGEGKALTYHKKVTVSGSACASVSYVDQTYTVCPGEMRQVD